MYSGLGTCYLAVNWFGKSEDKPADAAAAAAAAPEPAAPAGGPVLGGLKAATPADDTVREIYAAVKADAVKAGVSGIVIFSPPVLIGNHCNIYVLYIYN